MKVTMNTSHRQVVKNQNQTIISLPEARKYWKQVQLGPPNQLDFILNEAYRTAENRTVIDKPADVEVKMDTKSTSVLKSMCCKHDVTLNAAMQFAWHKLLQVYTGDDETIVGSTVSGRDLPVNGINESVGLFINTLPLVLQWKSGATSLEMLKQAHEKVADLSMYSQITLSEIIEGSGETPFYTLSVFQNFPKGNDKDNALFELDGTVIEKLNIPLGLVGYEQGGMLTVRLKFNLSWLSNEQAEELLHQMVRLLDTVAQNPNITHEDAAASMISDNERQKVLYEWNERSKPYRKDITVHRRFEESVVAMPDAIALEFQDEKITYVELNARANQMARVIREVVGPELNKDRSSFICLYLDRDVNTIVSLLGVLKAGAAYVPIAPDNATERAQMILEDASPVLILTNEHYTEKLRGLTNVQVYAVEQVDKSTSKDDLVDVERLPDDLAYMIYTSGTTGKPKGCMIEHHHLLHLGVATADLLEGAKRSLLYAAFVFDASVWELFGALLNDGTAILAGDDVRKDPSLLGEYISKKQVDWAVIPPVMAQAMDEKHLAVLKKLFLGGESSPLDLLDRTCKLMDVYNAIGPTECTVCCSVHKYQSGDSSTNIGKPLANVSMYALNASLKPVPVGVPGELYIGGAGVGRGYRNRPELNDEKFIDNPFAPGRMYKTGDAVRYLPNGDMQFLGRTDRQVKIRGYRIELGEIEAAIQDVDDIDQVVVIDVGQGRGKKLHAYFVGSADPDDLATLLYNRLPSYMMPSTFTVIDHVPMTVSGKVDRKALPEPTVYKVMIVSLPSTPLEAQLCNMFADVLGLEVVGTTDSFFTIGGSSITAADLVYRINNAGIANLRVKDIFDAPTVCDIADLIESQNESTDCSPGIVKRKSVRLSIAESHVRPFGSDSGNVSNTSRADRASLRASRIVRNFRRHSIMGHQYVFLIHPGGSDATVYQPLADLLHENYYNAKGIDNDAITSLKQYEMGRNLNQLGRFYASMVTQSMKKASDDEPIVLVGWSLGGKIAAEVAAVLERQGKTNVVVYMLDSFATTSLVGVNMDTVVGMKMEEFYSTRRKSLVERHPGLVEQYRRIAENEYFLLEQPISSYLEHSQVTLFKAGKVTNKAGSDEILQSALDIPDNGFRDCAKNFSVQLLEDYHHYNILDAKEMIVDYIVDNLPQFHRCSL